MFKLKMIKKPILFKLKCGFTFPPIVLANMQEKEVIPTKEQQEIVPDKNYDGLSKVIVQEIPTQYIIPSGNIQITENGTYDVRDKENAIVEIPEKKLGTKTITSNGTYNATDDNLDGYSQVSVETSGVDINDYFEINARGGDQRIGFGNWTNSVKKLPAFSLINGVYNMNYMYYGFQGENIDLSNIDTSNITRMASCFQSCSKIKNLDVSKFNTSNVTDMNQMFSNCENLVSLDLSNFDFSKNTNFFYFFNACYKLENIIFPSNIGEVSSPTRIDGMFRSCVVLKTVPLIDASKVITVSNLFYEAYKITNLGGFRNLGQAYVTTQSANYNTYTLDLHYCSSLTEQSIINVLNNLYDIATKGCNTQSVILGSTNLAKLTSEAGKQALQTATERGWSIR